MWHAEWQPLRECLRLTGGAATPRSSWPRAWPSTRRMRANLDLTGGLVVSERLAAALSADLGRVRAKAVVAQVSATAAGTGRPLAEALAAHPEVAAVRSPEELAALCDPRQYTGLAGRLVDRVVDHCRQTRPCSAG